MTGVSKSTFREAFDGRDLSSEPVIRELDEWVMIRLREAFLSDGDVKTTFFCLATHNPSGPAFPVTPWGILIVDGDGDEPNHLQFLFKKTARDYRALAVYFAAEDGEAAFLTREHRGLGNVSWRATLKRNDAGEALGTFECLPADARLPFTGFLDFAANPS
jgi:hypothetical protein